MKFKNLNELFTHELQKAYAAEHLTAAVLRGLAREGGLGIPLSSAERQETESRERIKRIEHVFGLIGCPPEAAPCPVAEDIVTEADQRIRSTDDPLARTAAQAAALNAIRHDRLARYETLALWAAALNMADVASALKGILEGERAAGATLPGGAGARSVGMGDRLTALFDHKK